MGVRCADVRVGRMSYVYGCRLDFQRSVHVGLFAMPAVGSAYSV